jgi:predicted transcriptional regulator
MSKVKSQIIKMIKDLPEEASIDDIIAELYFRLQVDKGLKELDEGNYISHKEVVERMSKWINK